MSADRLSDRLSRTNVISFGIREGRNGDGPDSASVSLQAANPEDDHVALTPALAAATVTIVPSGWSPTATAA